MKLRFYRSPSPDVYYNQAVEQYLLEQVAPDEAVLYLWQNERTVVIGRHQNAYRECRLDSLAAEGGRLARRLSGGGAVYHDSGNLNFTFCARNENYAVPRQLRVITEALSALKIPTVVSGRNDLVTTDGRKFSGNAFYRSGDHRFHHGTIMVAVDSAELAKYLKPSPLKLAARGVDSVRSRVVNLTELSPELTIQRLSDELFRAFGDVYNGAPVSIGEHELDKDAIAMLRHRFASPTWQRGGDFTGAPACHARFDWGEIMIHFGDPHAKQPVSVFSDALDDALITAVARALNDSVTAGSPPAEAIAALTGQYPRHRAMLLTIETLVREHAPGKECHDRQPI